MVAIAAAAIAGCSGATGGGAAGDLGVPALDSAAPPPPPDLSTPGPDLAGFPTVNVSIGPIALPPGKETTVCRVFKLPTQTDANVVRIDGRLLPGSHHLILYKSNETIERPDAYSCPPLDIGLGGGKVKAVPLYIAQTENDNGLGLPRGTAFPMPAGQMIKLEAHYLNATPNAIMAQGTVTLTLAPPGDPTKYVPADIMFCGSVTQLYIPGLPPGVTDLDPGFFQPQMIVPGIKMFGLTAHQHRYGTQMTIAKSTGLDDPGSLLVDGRPWDNEPFITWGDDDLVTFGPKEGLRWQCHYNNTTQSTVMFGESAATDEMCFFWGYYYPSAGHFVLEECQR
jgi:hypothetical protein